MRSLALEEAVLNHALAEQQKDEEQDACPHQLCKSE
jgi:hypothetical protein